ncbi:MAG: hypothetical protein KGY99_01225 [Phycisphaerae bacterium]|nr:hypothetical protein [Phycisphaerae bacterium]
MPSARIARNRALHENLFARRPFERHAFVVQPAGSSPLWEVGDFTTSDKPVADFVPWAAETYHNWVTVSDAIDDDAVPLVRPGTGTHIYAVAMGATPHFYEDNNPYATPCVANADEADALPEPELENCRPLMRIIELAAALRKELGDDVPLGPPDMQTGFDTACILWDKTDLLCVMVQNPEAVQRLAGKCSRLLKSFIAAYRREFPDACFGHCPTTWVPPGYGPWVSNDECGVMSPEMFEQFCLPELIDLSETFGGLGMHCCADAQHQFELFRRIPNFYAFNRVPTGVGWENDNAHQLLGGPDGPVLVPGWVAVEDIPVLLRTAPTGTRFIFNAAGMDDVDEAKQWLDGARRAVDAGADQAAQPQ